MRKLPKSNNLDFIGFKTHFLQTRTHNTSTKLYARFMHSLASVTFEQSPWRVFQYVPTTLPALPNRAARREHLQPTFPNCAARRAMSRAMKFSRPIMTPAYVPHSIPERKLTGAVRRGLERGRTA